MESNFYHKFCVPGALLSAVGKNERVLTTVLVLKYPLLASSGEALTDRFSHWPKVTGLVGILYRSETTQSGSRGLL